MSEQTSVADARAVVNAWPEPIAVLEASVEAEADGHGVRVRWCNSAFEGWLGEIPDQRIEASLLRCVAPDQRDTAAAALSPLASGEGSARCRFQVATSENDADGFPITTWLEATRCPLDDGATLLVLHDVGREAELERRLSEADASDLVSVYAHGVAHSVRNQLTVIMGSAFTLERAAAKADPELAASLRETLDRVAEVVKSATQQIQAFADFGSPTGDNSAADVPALFEESVRPLVDNAFIKARVLLEWGPCEPGITAVADRVALGGLFLRVLRGFMVGLAGGSVLRVEFQRRDTNLCVKFRGSERNPDPGIAARSEQDFARVKTAAENLGGHVERAVVPNDGVGLDIYLPIRSDSGG